MSLNTHRKRPFSEYSAEQAGNYYLCSACDSIYQGPDELSEHLAKHLELQEQARKRMCIRNSHESDGRVLGHHNSSHALVPSLLQSQPRTRADSRNDHGNSNTTANQADSSSLNVSSLKGLEKLAHARKMNERYFLYHQLRMCLDSILETRNIKSDRISCVSTLDILYDINEIQSIGQQLNLSSCFNPDFCNKIQARVLGSEFKQPLLKKHRRPGVNNSNSNSNSNTNTNTNDNTDTDQSQSQARAETGADAEAEGDADADGEEKESKPNVQDANKNKNSKMEETSSQKSTNNSETEFMFDSSDLQCFLDANSEIIGRVQTIRKEKSFYGVTQEEVKLNQQFLKNTTTIIKYADIPSRMLF